MEHGLDPRLGVVKVALDPDDVRVFPFLRDHLFFLDRTHAVLRIKNDNTRSRHISEASQRRLSRIPGCRC